MQQVTRKSIPIGDTGVSVAKAAQKQGPERVALERILGSTLPERSSEAQVMAAIYSIGLSRIQDELLAQQYAEFAVSRDAEDSEFEKANRARRATRNAHREAA